ncbi:hypothetical protein ACUV84_039933 [Puccinellia chinampoensis]
MEEAAEIIFPWDHLDVAQLALFLPPVEPYEYESSQEIYDEFVRRAAQETNPPWQVDEQWVAVLAAIDEQWEALFGPADDYGLSALAPPPVPAAGNDPSPTEQQA